MTDEKIKARIQALRDRTRRAAEARAAFDRKLPTVSDAQRRFLKRSDDPVVRWCNWSQQPDLRYACGIATCPPWGQPGQWTSTHLLPKASLAYLDDRGEAYVFEHVDRVTCPACIKAAREIARENP